MVFWSGRIAVRLFDMSSCLLEFFRVSVAYNVVASSVL
jgi:hypothetical protein